MNQCSKCGNEVKEGFHVCPRCGAKISSSTEAYKKEMKGKEKNSNQYYGLCIAFIAMLGVWIMFHISSPLGFIVYLMSFLLALSEVKKDYEKSDCPKGIFKFGLEYLRKQKFLSKGILILIIVAAPIMVIVGLDRWLFADTERMSDYIYDRFS